ASIWATHPETYQYEFHALNRLHGFRFLPERMFQHVLSVGGAFGHELLPIVTRICEITILDPSDAYPGGALHGVPLRYVKPDPTGIMPFVDGAFDLLTCFGCLHHIPNVSTVIREMWRCLVPGGMALLREPIVSMGDWRKPRPGLTKRERGIPLHLFRAFLEQAGFCIVHESQCGFALTSRLSGLGIRHVYNSMPIVWGDVLLSKLFAWNRNYHCKKVYQKFTPTLGAFVLRKPEATPEGM
ncbi:MAG: class I SAM-dependent methyltransferase, partial [Nitrospira sp.]